MAKKSSGLAVRASEDDWETESALRTLMEAEKIEKNPALMKKVRALAKSKLLEVAAIASGDGEEC